MLDTDLRALTRGGRAAPLTPKAFRLLEVLVEGRPRAISHAELRERVWGETLAAGTTLARLVTEVRAALGDGARPARYVRTVHRFGYAFCGAAADEATGAPGATEGCALQWGLQQILLSPGENVIGRGAGAVIRVASPKVSRRHARILVADGQATIEDLGSRNGTRLDGERIKGPVRLRHGHRIEIGPLELVFRVSAEEERTPSDSRR